MFGPVPWDEKEWGMTTDEFFSIEGRRMFEVRSGQKLILTRRMVWDLVDKAADKAVPNAQVNRARAQD